MVIKVVFHEAVLVEMMSPAGAVGRATRRAAGAVRDRAKAYAPVDTGLLRNSINYQSVPSSPKHAVYQIGTPVVYGRYQELGTAPIFARRAPLLVFKIRGTNRTVATLSTQGVPAVHFLSRALDELDGNDFRRGPL